ncbi:4Fe-4S binding protein [Dethiothermospora halolimnae]|uniref:4Fe-4S binding protein n=1 Tax=Dethiothermospora halolimnae TaxID=3114390 RepID=UPI003CCB8314
MVSKRHLVQLIATLTTNGYIKGFFNGKIYKGVSKKFCVPGLNCYSCPGALGSCPIGSIQAVIGSMKYNFSLYVLGFMSLVGVIFGRFICGWLCPFGFIQDLIHKVPLKKVKVPTKINNILKYLKYVILFTFVLLLPFIFQDDLGMSDPFFCKYICPAGTLEGGVPLILLNETLKDGLGFLFTWKLSILIIIVVSSIFIYRVFCRYLCPLGAFYSFFNKVSFYRLQLDKEFCNDCGVCLNTCKVDIKVNENPNSGECIRCGDCVKACPSKALKKGIVTKNKLKELA